MSWMLIGYHYFLWVVVQNVAVSRGYNTYFTKVLVWVMRTANVHWFWLKHQSSFNRKLGPLSDTLQAGAWLFLPFRKWPDHFLWLTKTNSQYGLWFCYCFSGLLPLRSHKGQVTFLEPFAGVINHLDYTRKLAKSILAQCDHLFLLGDNHIFSLAQSFSTQKVVGKFSRH